MNLRLAEPCIGTKDNSCVEVCPVDCIHPTPERARLRLGRDALHRPGRVHRLRCLRRGLPGRRLLRRDQLPAEWAKYAEINANY